MLILFQPRHVAVAAQQMPRDVLVVVSGIMVLLTL